MALDDNIKEIKSGIESLKKRPLSEDRTGLYIMMAIAMFGSIRSCYGTREILDNYQKAPQVQVENVIGQEASERFYELNWQRVYLEIDGKPVEQYVKER